MPADSKIIFRSKSAFAPFRIIIMLLSPKSEYATYNETGLATSAFLGNLIITAQAVIAGLLREG